MRSIQTMILRYKLVYDNVCLEHSHKKEILLCGVWVCIYVKSSHQCIRLFSGEKYRFSDFLSSEDSWHFEHFINSEQHFFPENYSQIMQRKLPAPRDEYINTEDWSKRSEKTVTEAQAVQKKKLRCCQFSQMTSYTLNGSMAHITFSIIITIVAHSSILMIEMIVIMVIIWNVIANHGGFQVPWFTTMLTIEEKLWNTYKEW